jgi:hypothetical protein
MPTVRSCRVAFFFYVNLTSVGVFIYSIFPWVFQYPVSPEGSRKIIILLTLFKCLPAFLPPKLNQ